MTTVAEGIEDQADCDSLLQKMGVDLVQSYFVAKQMPAEDLKAWLSA
jgi:EAL domain-containing protein (putative c-di-GMP-specific phosphodiesterase class I)